VMERAAAHPVADEESFGEIEEGEGAAEQVEFAEAKGGEEAAPPVPLDQDGIPLLTADWSEQQSITDTLHNVDHLLVDNEAVIKDALLSFETYTASLKSEGDAIDGALAKADDGFASFDKVVARINAAIPGLTEGEEGALFQKVRSIHELAESFDKHSGVVLEEARQTLADVSDGAIRMTYKLNPQAVVAQPQQPAPPRKPLPKRQ